MSMSMSMSSSWKVQQPCFFSAANQSSNVGSNESVHVAKPKYKHHHRHWRVAQQIRYIPAGGVFILIGYSNYFEGLL